MVHDEKNFIKKQIENILMVIYIAGTRNNVAVMILFYRLRLFNLCSVTTVPVHTTLLQLAKFIKEQIKEIIT